MVNTLGCGLLRAKMKEKPCACEVHLKAEEMLRKDGKTDFLKCRGHGPGCPCYEKENECSEAGTNEK